MGRGIRRKEAPHFLNSICFSRATHNIFLVWKFLKNTGCIDSLKSTIISDSELTPKDHGPDARGTDYADSHPHTSPASARAEDAAPAGHDPAEPRGAGCDQASL